MPFLNTFKPSADKLHIGYEDTPATYCAYYDPEGLIGRGKEPIDAVRDLLEQTEDAWRDALNERDEAKRALSEGTRSIKHEHTGVCVWCGFNLPVMDGEMGESTITMIREHSSVCEKHPQRVCAELLAQALRKCKEAFLSDAKQPIYPRDGNTIYQLDGAIVGNALNAARAALAKHDEQRVPDLSRGLAETLDERMVQAAKDAAPAPLSQNPSGRAYTRQQADTLVARAVDAGLVPESVAESVAQRLVDQSHSQGRSFAGECNFDGGGQCDLPYCAERGECQYAKQS